MFVVDQVEDETLKLRVVQRGNPKLKLNRHPVVGPDQRGRESDGTSVVAVDVVSVLGEAFPPQRRPGIRPPRTPRSRCRR